MSEKTFFFELTKNQFKSWSIEHGLPAYTLSQVHQWVVDKKTLDYSKMSNISKKNQRILNDYLVIDPFTSCEKVAESDSPEEEKVPR